MLVRTRSDSGEQYRFVWQPQSFSQRFGDERRLVIAPFALPLAVQRHRHYYIRVDAGRADERFRVRARRRRFTLIGRNEPRQSVQMGMRVASVSSCSQMRQLAGNTKLSNAARTLLSHPPVTPRVTRELPRSNPQSNYYLVI